MAIGAVKADILRFGLKHPGWSCARRRKAHRPPGRLGGRFRFGEQGSRYRSL